MLNALKENLRKTEKIVTATLAIISVLQVGKYRVIENKINRDGRD
jgi:hypothetical protein